VRIDRRSAEIYSDKNLQETWMRAVGSTPVIAVAVALLFAGAPAAARESAGRWVGSWAAAQLTLPPQNAVAAADLTDATLRQVVRLSLGGEALRVRLSNAFGTEPLRITSAHVASAVQPGTPRIDPGSDRALTFAGRSEVVIPAGADFVSDPLPLAVKPQTALAVSLHFEAPPAAQTGHPVSRSTSFLVHGDMTAASDLPDAARVEHWYQLTGVEVLGAPTAAAVATLGDSITDGDGATTDADDRWPDALARRLQADPATRRVGVLNVGIAGNRVLQNGLGPNALARFDRDVLARPGVRWVILLEGVNDLGVATRDHPISPEAHAGLVRNVIAAYQQMIERAHAQGVKVVGATILPYGGSAYYHPDAANEQDRAAINAWIRELGHFDAVLDFDRLMRDASEPTRMRADFDSGDHLHPSPAGYRAMAEGVPLALFKTRP